MIGVLQSLKIEHDWILLHQLIFKSHFFPIKKKIELLNQMAIVNVNLFKFLFNN